ncbi:MAG TPA: flavodoxin family protein [Syntrophomonadaceae bacterium]|nr:flavodoxin family protein [Syntrophomonadaceae bacterium]
MLILGINGSPNKDGNTAFLLRQGLAVAQEMGAETRLIQVSEVLAGLDSPFCDACATPCDGSCGDGNRLGEVLELLRRADGMLVGSPVYFGSISGQLKAFWDKTRVLRSEKALLNVVGGGVTVAGARFGGQETALRAIHDLMLVQGMILVGDGLRDYDCGHQGACAHSPAGQDENGIKRTGILARRIVEVARATEGLRIRKRG